MTSHETGSTGTPDTSRVTAPPARTFGPQGPTLGELSDAYLQDYQVRQFRSQSTARGRIAHLTACFGRDAHAAALTTYQIRQYQLARRAAGAATGTINRETSALHRMCTLSMATENRTFVATENCTLLGRTSRAERTFSR